MAIATSFVVRLSMPKFGLTSVNSIIFVFERLAASFTSMMNSPARKPIGDGAEVPGASDERTASMSKPKNVLSVDVWRINFSLRASRSCSSIDSFERIYSIERQLTPTFCR
jgi:hypothetical protein